MKGKNQKTIEKKFSLAKKRYIFTQTNIYTYLCYDY